MIDPARLTVEHRTGAPPPTAALVGPLATPDGNTVVAAFGRGRVVLCWWATRTPTLGELRAFHRFHGFAPLPPRRRRARRRRKPHGDPATSARLALRAARPREQAEEETMSTEEQRDRARTIERQTAT